MKAAREGTENPEDGHSTGTVKLDGSMTANILAVASKGSGRPSDLRSVGRPRLLSLKQAAEYVGVSYWLLRDYVIEGILKPVRLPGSRLKVKAGPTDAPKLASASKKPQFHWRLSANSRSHSMRKIMLDREDLDRLIAEYKGD